MTHSLGNNSVGLYTGYATQITSPYVCVYVYAGIHNITLVTILQYYNNYNINNGFSFLCLMASSEAMKPVTIGFHSVFIK